MGKDPRAAPHDGALCHGHLSDGSDEPLEVGCVAASSPMRVSARALRVMPVGRDSRKKNRFGQRAVLRYFWA
jgi:hypothetical protein